MVAGALKDLSGWENDILFSSGVSNSTEQDEKNYQKEIDLVKLHLGKLIHPASFVYFSTTSIFDPLKKGNAYIQHKLAIEELIKKSNLNFLIIRLPNLVGFSSNPNTLTNYFANSVRNERIIHLNQNAIRHLIDAEDLSSILNDIKNNFGKINLTVNVETDRPLSAQQILSIIEDIMKKKAHIKPSTENVDFKSSEVNLDVSSRNYIWKIKEGYHRDIIKKYYSI